MSCCFYIGQVDEDVVGSASFQSKFRQFKDWGPRVEQEGEQYAKKNGMLFFETSAKAAQNTIVFKYGANCGSQRHLLLIYNLVQGSRSASKVRSALFTFSKVVYTANKDKQYRVFKEEVRSLASEVAAKHLAKSSSADQLLGFTASVVHIKTSDDRLNMDDKVWEHPKEWRPERFLDENNDSVDLYKMMAFGGGKRVCAAVHSKLYMSISRMAIGKFIQEFDS
ncbi:hypothetical protein RJ640_030052 [Escallonia rubra]|uniref:Cytochrome P450 n=1 Tax=Escallonia rubra TaxID=112253 RepID=A0AA88SNC2_9ASTE|nr:hypothetical protein RJ640_030052 [Escallonia rubra]